ncbi:esterase/lipase family protein [Flagellimonas sp.]|uniref:esterase/lipase family protein n=1 Tax=Flagellimonas sp. TaxID=2058762 RepID=UPI003F49DD4B
MKDKLNLYKAFIKLNTTMGLRSSLSEKGVRKILIENFADHPDSEELMKLVKEDTPDREEDLNFLFNECIRICDELGPSREYFTLVTLFEHITEDFIEKKGTKEAILFQNILEQFRQEIALINQKIPKPPLFNMLLEGRSLVEWTSIYAIYPFIPKRIKGEGRPVLLIPPYLGDDYSTSFVRRYLTSLGFKTYKWEQGFNLVKSHYIPRLEEKLDDIYRTHGEKVNIVGWSGGGIFAKIMANRHPQQVEQIITIGSPVWGVMDMKTPVSGILEFFRGKSLKERNKRFIEELEPIPNVPITCIYTKTDGLLPWKHCMEAESFRDDIKNIEVYGSHSGLGANVSVLLITANALSANIKGKTISDTTTNIERILYPFYWNKKKRSLFFLN